MRSALFLAFALVFACGSFGDSEEGSAPPTDAGSTQEGAVPSDDAGAADGTTSPDGSSPSLEKVLIGGRNLPLAISATESFVVWGEDTGEVQRISIDGGAIENVSKYGGSPRQVLLRDDDVMWADHTVDKMGFWHHAAGAGDARTASTLGITAFAQLGSTADFVTFSSNDSVVTILGPDGSSKGATQPLANPFDLVTDGDGVLLALSGGATIARISASAPTTVDSLIEGQSDCRNVARNDTSIFWSVGSTRVRRRDRAMGVASDISTNENGVHALAADDTGLYWLTNDSLRHWSPVTNAVETMTSGFTEVDDSLARSRLHRVALTSKYVVWLTKTEVRRIEK